MKTTDIRSINDLPADLSLLQSLAMELLFELQMLRSENTLMRKELYGRRSEKRRVVSDSAEGVQCELDELLAQLPPAPPPAAQESVVVVPAHERRRRHAAGRNAIPEDAEVEERVIDVPPQQRCCAQGHTLVKIGTVERLIVERTPARYKVIKVIRSKYACPCCKDGVVVAEAPLLSPIGKGLAGLSLLLFVLISKYRYHLPLYRIQRQMYHEGRFWFTRSTMVGWIREICVPLGRIYAAMVEEVKGGGCIHGDESRVRRQTDSSGGSALSWMWVWVGAEGRVAVFDYRRTRGSEAALKFLQGCAAGTYLMSDAYSAYGAAVKKYGLCAMVCMVHLRRQFVEALECDSEEAYAKRIIALIGRLYVLERYATERGYTTQQRGEMRNRYSRRVMEKIHEKLLVIPEGVLPSNRIFKAIGYARSHWAEALRFLERGDLPIDNNIDERVIRTLAVGRKNWLSVGSDEGGRCMAILYSIVASCELNGLDVEEYLREVVMRVVIRPQGQPVADLTPREWARSKNGGTLPPVAQMYPSKS